jgi:hypothetical protein
MEISGVVDELFLKSSMAIILGYLAEDHAICSEGDLNREVSIIAPKGGTVC